MSKTILITGSTDGIGKLAAFKLAQEGYEVYLHGRNPQKLQATLEELKQTSPHAKVDGFVADFSDLQQVLDLANEVNNRLERLDVLINNAGVFQSPTPLTRDSWDIRFVVNYFAPYLLSKKLIPLLQQSSQARLINLGSAAQASVSLEAMQGSKLISVQESYAQSKLALTMWSFELAKSFENPSVMVINPGSLLNTKMVQEAYGKYWSPADKGSNILYDLSVSHEYDGLTGKYFDNDKGEKKGTFGPAHSDAYESDKIEHLIKSTEILLAKYL